MTSKYNGFVKTREIVGGYECAVYYRDDDDNSGNGDYSQIAYWFGRYDESPSKPAESAWFPVTGQERKLLLEVFFNL